MAEAEEIKKQEAKELEKKKKLETSQTQRHSTNTTTIQFTPTPQPQTTVTQSAVHDTHQPTTATNQPTKTFEVTTLKLEIKSEASAPISPKAQSSNHAKSSLSLGIFYNNLIRQCISRKNIAHCIEHS